MCPPLFLFFVVVQPDKYDKCSFRTLKTRLIETYFLLKLTKKLEKTRIVEPFLLSCNQNKKNFPYLETN